MTSPAPASPRFTSTGSAPLALDPGVAALVPRRTAEDGFVKRHLEFASGTAHQHQRPLPRSDFPALLDEAIAHGGSLQMKDDLLLQWDVGKKGTSSGRDLTETANF